VTEIVTGDCALDIGILVDELYKSFEACHKTAQTLQKGHHKFVILFRLSQLSGYVRQNNSDHLDDGK
jgi:hypothetical protein